MISYFIHTYHHASGHKTVTKRTVYLPSERDEAANNLAVLGGVIEIVKTTQLISAKVTKS